MNQHNRSGTSLMKTFIGILVVLSLGAASPTFAAPALCAPYDAGVRSLFNEFGEVIIGRGVNFEGNLVELLVAEDGSWTLLVILPNKLSCFLATGEGWESVQPMAPLPKLPQEIGA